MLPGSSPPSWLERGGGTVECGLRKGDRAWRLGLASYQREELYWFRVFGISMRPQETFPRRDLTLVARRLPSEAEAASLGPGMIVVECQLGEGQLGEGAGGGGAGAVDDAVRAGDSRRIELALAESALTGLLSWLEAAPPGSHLDIAL